MRAMGVDLGTRRIGLAVSDPSGTLARPWKTLPATGTPQACAETVAAALEEFVEASRRAERGDPGTTAGLVDVLVVGLPLRLGGGDTHLTEHVRSFAAALAARTGLVVHLQDERLSSHEADARLKVRERDWRKRKAKLDAAAAAVILQDFLDTGATRASLAGC
jgi:putative Holliday junction resolvase